jgi:hypothetical protein
MIILDTTVVSPFGLSDSFFSLDCHDDMEQALFQARLDDVAKWSTYVCYGTKVVQANYLTVWGAFLSEQTYHLLHVLDRREAGVRAYA